MCCDVLIIHSEQNTYKTRSISKDRFVLQTDYMIHMAIFTSQLHSIPEATGVRGTPSRIRRTLFFSGVFCVEKCYPALA